ncbi:MAG TPA: fibronectin type III domain-containing protein [Gemmatimonadota bacterium]|nr:fibronectin type III domain-containing protein [Gemmatimonadota bacterium]
MTAPRRAAVAVGGFLLVAVGPVAAQSPPNAPVNLEADVTSERVRLTWDEDDSGPSAESFRVYRDDELIGTPTDEDHVDFDVVEGAQYTYEVSAVRFLVIEGERSDPLTVVIPGGDPPGRPDNLMAESVSSSQIDLRWDAVRGDDDDEPAVAGYYIYRDGGSVPHDSTGGAQYSDTGLTAFTEYTYRVSAVSTGGVEGELSNAASARTADGSPPGAPQGVTAEATGARVVELAWDAAEDPESGISRYLVYRDEDAAPIDSTTATGYTDGTAEPETSYSYRVSARNGVGLEGPTSAAAEVTTPAATDPSPPSTPAGFSAEAVSPDRVELTWSAAEDPESGVSEYRVYRDDSLLGTSPGVGYVDLTVEPSTTYEYEVAAVNGDGLEGSRASAPPVTTPGLGEGPADTVPPAPPSGLRVVSD